MSAADQSSSITREGYERLPAQLVELVSARRTETAEAEPRRCRISIQSPVGQAILGRRVGDVVRVDAPGGTHRIAILRIEAPAETLAA